MCRMFELLGGGGVGAYISPTIRHPMAGHIPRIMEWNQHDALCDQQPSIHIWIDASGCFGCGAWEPHVKH